MSEVVVFFREDGFYPVRLSGLKPVDQECADHAEINPGTIRVETLDGKVVWPEGAKQ